MSSQSVNEQQSYVMQTGDAGAVRLRILNTAYGPGTERLLDGLGDWTGKQVADLGCGTGVISATLLRRVGRAGRVVAVDAAADTLQAAMKTMTEQESSRIEWKEADVNSLPFPDASFDVAYCRLLLLHMKDPSRAIAEMIRVTKPSGYVICEDVAACNAQTFPTDSPIKKMQDTISAMAAKAGTDWNVGLALAPLMKSAGLEVVRIETHQPSYLSGEGKRLAEYTFLEASAKMVAAKVITAEGAEQMGAAMRAFSDREDTAVYLPSMIQVVGKKPA